MEQMAADLAADGLTIFAYTPEPGSRSAQSMALLDSWDATPDPEHTAEIKRD